MTNHDAVHHGEFPTEFRDHRVALEIVLPPDQHKLWFLADEVEWLRDLCQQWLERNAAQQEDAPDELAPTVPTSDASRWGGAFSPMRRSARPSADTETPATGPEVVQAVAEAIADATDDHGAISAPDLLFALNDQGWYLARRTAR